LKVSNTVVHRGLLQPDIVDCKSRAFPRVFGGKDFPPFRDESCHSVDYDYDDHNNLQTNWRIHL
jgi:hypothetical protein